MRTRHTGAKPARTPEQDKNPINGGVVPVTASTKEEEYPYLHQLVRGAIEVFERDREKHLAEGHSELDWIAYHGERLIGIAPSDLELRRRCDREKIPADEVFFHTLHAIVKRAYVNGLPPR